ncbi:hypothetical protein LXL04_033603 [Taraxacum kok-saghyz]
MLTLLTRRNLQHLLNTAPNNDTIPKMPSEAVISTIPDPIATFPELLQLTEPFPMKAIPPFVKKFKTIIHPGEVNRIRELPPNSKIIATHTDSGPLKGLWKEAVALNELRQSDTCKILVHIFFAQNNTSKEDDEKSLVAAVAQIKGKLNPFSLSLLLFGVILPSFSANLEMAKENHEKAVSLLKGVLDYDSFKDVDSVVEICQLLDLMFKWLHMEESLTEIVWFPYKFLCRFGHILDFIKRNNSKRFFKDDMEKVIKYQWLGTNKNIQMSKAPQSFKGPIQNVIRIQRENRVKVKVN